MLPGTVLEPVSECFLASLIIGWAAHYVFRYLTNQRADTGCCSLLIIIIIIVSYYINIMY